MQLDTQQLTIVSKSVWHEALSRVASHEHTSRDMLAH